MPAAIKWTSCISDFTKIHQMDGIRVALPIGRQIIVDDQCCTWILLVRQVGGHQPSAGVRLELHHDEIPQALLHLTRQHTDGEISWWSLTALYRSVHELVESPPGSDLILFTMEHWSAVYEYFIYVWSLKPRRSIRPGSNHVRCRFRHIFIIIITFLQRCRGNGPPCSYPEPAALSEFDGRALSWVLGW